MKKLFLSVLSVILIFSGLSITAPKSASANTDLSGTHYISAKHSDKVLGVDNSNTGTVVTQQYNQNLFNSTNNSVTFSLEDLFKQEQTFTSPSGEQITVGIEPVNKIESKMVRPLDSSSTYKIYYYTLAWNVHYYIDVKNYRITRAYDAGYIGLAPVNSDKLTYDSLSAVYSIDIGISFASAKVKLKATINPSQKTLTTDYTL